MGKDRIFHLCDIVRETSFALHRFLRHGHREMIYQRGLAHRLENLGLKVSEQFETKVFDEDGYCLGTFPADMLVEDALLIELKAVSAIHPDHQAQIIGYLRASQIDHGLLINFGASKLEIKKFVSPRVTGNEVREEQRVYEVCNS